MWLRSQNHLKKLLNYVNEELVEELAVVAELQTAIAGDGVRSLDTPPELSEH